MNKVDRIAKIISDKLKPYVISFLSDKFSNELAQEIIAELKKDGFFLSSQDLVDLYTRKKAPHEFGLEKKPVTSDDMLKDAEKHGVVGKDYCTGHMKTFRVDDELCQECGKKTKPEKVAVPEKITSEALCYGSYNSLVKILGERINQLIDWAKSVEERI